MRHLESGSPVHFDTRETAKLFLSDCCGREVVIDAEGSVLPRCEGPTCSAPDAATWNLLATTHL